MIDYATIYPETISHEETQSETARALTCMRMYPAACQCRRYGPRAINPCDAVDRQLVELSPIHHRSVHRSSSEVAEGVPAGYATLHAISPLSHEERREVARLTGTHFGPVSLDEETGAALPGYRFRHPYVSREASGAVPVSPVTPFM